jgi:peptidoglycan/LPS O-acetylase OafA/YrhL
MWGRILQLLVACWLAASPFVFGHGADATYLLIHDFASAAVIALFALLSFHPRLKHAHLATALPAFWMIAAAFVSVPSPPPPAYQNHVILGLFLLILVLVPSHASAPPRLWREYHKSEDRALSSSGHSR